MEITRELDKESLLDCYPIYISYTWSMLWIITPALMSMHHPWVHHIYTIVKIVEGGLCSFLFLFLFFFYSLFLFLEQLRLEIISHAVTSITTWWHSHKTDHGTRTKWRHTTWIPHVGLMYYSWSFRIGCTVVSTDHGD